MAKSIPFPDKNWELIEGRLNSFALISHCNLNPLWDLGVRKNQISGDLGDAPPQKKRSSARFLRRQLSHTYRPSTHFLRCTLHTLKKMFSISQNIYITLITPITQYSIILLSFTLSIFNWGHNTPRDGRNENTQQCRPWRHWLRLKCLWVLFQMIPYHVLPVIVLEYSIHLVFPSNHNPS
jgi:hypothetical protein